MKKGSVKILMVMVAILAGLTLLFMMTLKSNVQTQQSAQAEQRDEIKMEQRQNGMELEQKQDKKEEMEKKSRVYSEDLDEFKRMVTNLEQKDMVMFKNQSRDAFMELADLIDQLGEQKDDILSGTMVEEEDTEEIRRSARKIIAAENEDELLKELKNSFNAAEEALEEATEETVDEEKYEKTLDNLEKNIEELNKENYMNKSKDIFMQFYAVLKNLHNEKRTART